MKISYHGHSVVYFESHGKKIIIDPFINGNTHGDLEVSDVKVDYIILTHGHNDHVGDTVELAKQNNAKVIAVFELAGYLESFGIETVALGIGGQRTFDFGTVKFVHAFHSSSHTDDKGHVNYTGMPAGIIVANDDFKFYHMGDTGLFGDIQLISDVNGPFDVTFVPIGDNFTMGIDDAAYAVNNMLDTKVVVPIHYNTFPDIEVDASKFVEATRQKARILKPGESLSEE